MQVKKVIFIGGTAYSGSTFTDMIIANDPGGFSCGEVKGLFYPFKNHHFKAKCGCGDAECDIWQKVLHEGVENLFASLFSMFPDIRYIVDSSKDPLWIKTQSEYLKRQGIQAKHVLIWKFPLEYASSFKKRGLHGWERSWINYHRTYFAVINDTVAVKYNAFAKDKDGETLKKLCEYLEIPYHDGKAEYWHKKHHTLFGNSSAKFHLYGKESQHYQRLLAQLKREQKEGSTHQSIYYKEVIDQALVAETQHAMANHPAMGRIVDWLENGSENGIKTIHRGNPRISFGNGIMLLRQSKHWVLNFLRKRRK